jgi:hypothetical protein
MDGIARDVTVDLPPPRGEAVAADAACLAAAIPKDV